jgi:exonuclease SbcC
MKILAISLKNLASFAGEVTVDFRTAPLSHAGVFAIIGPTGAGKSTLLDALCLALYGKTPRTSVGNKDTALEGDGDKPWYLRDARHLIRRGVDEARASVRFESDGREYEATWSCKRRPRARTLEDPKVSLTSEGTVLADKITDLVDQVFTLTGLDFESFCRSVLLPQGQFERFLACNSDERSKLLEALTDPAGLYRGVSALAQERHAASQKRTDEARADVQRILVLNDEERDALEARIASHDDDARRTTEALTRAKEARQRHALIENAAMRAAELRSEAARKAAHGARGARRAPAPGLGTAA